MARLFLSPKNKHGRPQTPFYIFITKAIVVFVILALFLYLKENRNESQEQNEIIAVPTKVSPILSASALSTTMSTNSALKKKRGLHKNFLFKEKRISGLNNTIAHSVKPEKPLRNEHEEDDSGNSKICPKVTVYKGDQCAFALEQCPNALGGGFVNYIVAKFCWFKKAQFMFYVCAFLWLLVLFYLLSDTTEANFCPALTEIARALKLSPNVAGVTFLALGNGASDISSILAGVLSGSSGFGLGEPIGSGLFITTIVVAICSLITPVYVRSYSFLRDLGVYTISVIYVFFVSLTGKFTLWQSLVCLAIYLVYVLIVIFGNYAESYIPLAIAYMKGLVKPSLKAHNTGLTADDDGYNNDESENLIISSASKPKYYGSSIDNFGGNSNGDDEELEDVAEWTKDMKPIFDLQLNTLDEALQHEHLKEKLSRSNSIRFFPKPGNLLARKASAKNSPQEDKYKGSIILKNHFRAPSHDELGDQVEDEDANNDGQPKHPILVLIYNFLEWIGWTERSWYEKIFFFFEGPTILIRNLTIPKADPADWSKFFAVLNPIFMPIFTCAIFGFSTTMIPHTSIPVLVVAGLAGIPFSILVLLTSSRDKPPRYHFVNVAMAFVMSVVWIYAVANELVDLLQAVGILWKVSDAILATTVLSWGNCLGDTVADIIVARQGYPEMAVGACYGGPCLNLLLGLGIAITAHCMKGATFAVTMDPTMILSFAFLLISLVSAIIVVPMCRFTSTKPFGIVLIIIYTVYTVLNILIETRVIMK